MNEELGGLLLAREVNDDGLADAVHPINPAASQSLNNLVGRRLERLGFVAGPDGTDGLAVDTLMNAIGDGFDFGKLGHVLLQV